MKLPTEREIGKALGKAEEKVGTMTKRKKIIAAGVLITAGWLVAAGFTLRIDNRALLILQAFGGGISIALTIAAYRTEERHSHGEHRRAGQEVRGDPVSGAGSDNNPGAESATPNAAPTAARAGTGPVRTTGRKRAVESAGIIIGEVEAFRCWRLAGHYLMSINGRVWLPDRPMTGLDVDVQNSSGVHAFKNLADAHQYAVEEPSAVGRVRLWGAVVEHESGYRAEYGRPIEILEMVNVADADVRKRAVEAAYGMTRAETC